SNHLALALALPPYLALHLTPGHRASRWEFDEAHLVIGVGKWSFWGGRRALGFHQGVGGGIVLTSNQVFDGGGVYLADPIALPWLLEYLGPVRFDLFLTRIENGDRITDPWFGIARGMIEPHSRLELGFNRANIFGGKGNSPTTPRSVLQMILGMHAGEEGEYNNEVFSIDLRYRPPLGSVPLSFYLEWGMDDSAGGWWYVPARVVGVELAAVPGVPEVALGIERTSFAEGCCGNTIWYRNWSLRGGWADGGRPLGHSLGGHGTEWLVHGQSDIFSARVRMRFQIFTRNRGYENLFAPEREGRSTGGRISLDGSVGHLFGISLQGMIEEGNDGWRESALRVGVQVRF
ncbi:MAG TPA: capsule assembly Wzi family protein, partial [Beutenbergiaceae bacterium]|nr:capsule assembly Wzi family protein [Beutenbergiaceae bacterium]